MGPGPITRSINETRPVQCVCKQQMRRTPNRESGEPQAPPHRHGRAAGRGVEATMSPPSSPRRRGRAAQVNNCPAASQRAAAASRQDVNVPSRTFKKKKFLLLLCSRVATLFGLFFHNKSTTSYQPVVLSEQISTNHHPPAKRTNSGSCDPIYGSDVLSERFLKSALVQH